MANYSKGKIAIPNVTGNIVINITAVQSAPSYTNQIPISKDTSGNVYNGVGYKTGYRLNSSGVETASANHDVTGFIPFTIGDTIRTKGFNATGTSEGIQFYNSSFVSLGGYKGFNIKDEAAYNVSTGSFEWTPPSTIYDAAAGGNKDISNAAYIRLSMFNTMPASDAVVTINEEIG